MTPTLFWLRKKLPWLNTKPLPLYRGIPPLYRLLSFAFVPAILLLWLLARPSNTDWAGSAQIVALVATVLALVGVWHQLAVQTVATILGYTQDDTSRNARAALYDLENVFHISTLQCREGDGNEWDKNWEQTADQVAQNWSRAGYLLRIDPLAKFLLNTYIAKTRRAILKSHFICQPRIICRRTSTDGQGDLWVDFDWLAQKAAENVIGKEARDWGLPDGYVATLLKMKLYSTYIAASATPPSDRKP